MYVHSACSCISTCFECSTVYSVLYVVFSVVNDIYILLPALFLLSLILKDVQSCTQGCNVCH